MFCNRKSNLLQNLSSILYYSVSVISILFIFYLCVRQFPITLFALLQIKTKQLQELNIDAHNEVLEPHGRPVHLRHEHLHKIRHNKMVHAQISRLARSQDQLDESQQSLQTQLLDVQRRLDRYEEPNWNLMSTKVEFLEFENKVIRTELSNTTQKVRDLDKVHSSMLELREDVESIENKVDKTIPEFRKEISKLDINFAQVSMQLINKTFCFGSHSFRRV